MRYLTLFALSILLTHKEALAFICDTSGEGYKTQVKFSTDTKPTATIEHGKSKGNCKLNIVDAEDLMGGVVPGFRFVFERLSCGKQLTEAQLDKLLPQFYLNISKRDKTSYRAQIQWHRNLQPTECKISEIEINSLKKIALDQTHKHK